MLAQTEIRPQRLKEIARGIEWNTANNVSEGRAEKYAQQQARDAKHKIPQRNPHRALDMIAEFHGGAAQNQKPKHDRQRQIKTAKAAGVKRGKREVESAADGEQPHFVAVPHRANAGDDLTTFFGSTRHEKVDRAGAEVEAIE